VLRQKLETLIWAWSFIKKVLIILLNLNLNGLKVSAIYAII
jgi:hypothetical protein